MSLSAKGTGTSLPPPLSSPPRHWLLCPGRCPAPQLSQDHAQVRVYLTLVAAFETIVPIYRL